MSDNIKETDYRVLIPSIDGDGTTEAISIRVPVTICPNTGEEMLTEEAFNLIEATKARYMGLLSPEGIKQIRLRHRLSQREMSALLQTGEKSYTRWETGHSRPSRVINLLLRAVDEGKLTMEWLQAQRARSFSWSKVIRPGVQYQRQPPVYFSFVGEDSPRLPLMEPSYETVAAAA
jgi:putative zinc finger/helix-turn-helix YgiT family protein